MDKLEVGKKYRTKNANGEIDFDYKVLDILNNKVVFKVLEDRTTLPFSSYRNVKALTYDINSQFVRNSKELT